MTFIQTYIKQLKLDQLALDLFSKTISLILLLLFFYLGKKLITYLFLQTVAKSIALTKQTEARQKTIVKLLHNIMDYALYFMLIYWILSIIGVPISSLLAGAGLAGVALGLGAKDFLSDLVNGFFILLENQYDVGETVEIGLISGNVASVGIRTTQVRGFDGTLHTIPNRNISVVSNKSRGDMRAQIDIPILAHTNLELMTSIIKQVNKEQVPNFPEIVGPPNVLGPRTTTSGQLVFRVDIFVENGKQNTIYSKFYILYQEALLANDIHLPTLNAVSTTKK